MGSGALFLCPFWISLPVRSSLLAASYALFYLIFPFVLPPITESLAFVHFISSVCFCSPLFFSSANFAPLPVPFSFVTICFLWSDSSLTVVRILRQAALPYKMSSSQTFVPVSTCRQFPVLLVLLAQTCHGNRPLVETLPTLCFHPSSRTICSRLMSCHGVDEQAATTAAYLICHMLNHENISA